MIPLHDDVEHRRMPLVTYLLIGANIAVFILQLKSEGRITDEYAAVPARIVQGERLYTVLTSMFLHGGFFHILSNMWFLYIFGDNVEDAFGHLGYLVMYLTSGICGAVLQILVSFNSTVPMVGASGAISGVLGAYMVLFPGARILTLVPIFYFLRFVNIPAVIFLGFWIMIQVLNGMLTPRTGGGIAFFAHIGGFVCGFVLALLLRLFFRRRARYSIY